jgi:large subunit ribosomal protein L5
MCALWYDINTNSKGNRKMTTTKNLKARYVEDVIPAMKEKFGYKNIHQVPKIVKIVLNMGVGEASHNSKIAEAIENQLTKIAGQKAVVTKAKKSIASYKLREGMPVGAMATLRGERMYDFMQKLICVVLPRIRDFRGVSAKSFDGRGNYTLGLKEQALFPEISYEEVDLVKGMNVSVITTANTDEEARELLRLLGMPFKK